ncbi:MAG: hypothetical protein ACM3O4_05605 [Ignavibacteriales bacterium]
MKIKREIKELAVDEITVLRKENQFEKRGYTFWKYNYENYYSKKNYDFYEFSKIDNSKQNYNEFYKTNFETNYMMLEKSYSLTIPIIMQQALGKDEALMLVELSRLSINFPVNKYGFFLTSSSVIQDDTSLSEYQQRKIAKNLENWGFIETRYFENPINVKFYRFNDDFTCREYQKWKGLAGKFKLDIGRQYKKI